MFSCARALSDARGALLLVVVVVVGVVVVAVDMNLWPAARWEAQELVVIAPGGVL
jgi:hypothetical protein